MRYEDFRALRETVGATQRDVADALGVDTRAVKRWEAGTFELRPDAVELVLRWYDEFNAGVDAVMDAVEDALDEIESNGGSMDCVDPVMISYYRTQEQYNRHHDDGGDFGRVNAIARQAALLITDIGLRVEFHYPDEESDA